ncbi:MAG: phage capsid protein [Balneolales bacterium]
MPELNRPFPQADPELVAISIAYQNTRLIADKVFPRKPVGKEEFKYYKFPKGSFITVPDTTAGRKGKLNEVNFEAEQVTDSTVPHGLKAPVPQSDIDNAPDGLSPLNITTEGLRDLVLLDREVRCANKAFDADEYAADNKVQLAGTDQWSDYANSSPIDDIETGLNVPMIRPNKLLIGQAAWSVLRQHPEIIAAVNKNDGDKGLATKAAVAELFELDEVIVGQGWVNIAKPGQPVNKVRVWGKHTLLFNDNATATPTLGLGMTFGFTAQHGDPVAGTVPVPGGDMGLDGGVNVINGEKVKELIAANDLGYFIEDCVA